MRLQFGLGQSWLAAATLAVTIGGLGAGTPATLAAGDDAVVIQDFENKFPITPWPEKAQLEFSTEWAADGKQSLKLYKGTMAAVDQLSIKDWSPYQELRIHVKVAGDQGAVVGLELADDVNGYLNRHQQVRSAPAGESVVAIDISGDLWRGEANRPNRDNKSPVHLNKISRLAVTANDAVVYIDKMELVKLPRPTTPGGFAFDFGKPGGISQWGWTAVNPEDRYSDEKGFGMSGGPRAFRMYSPFPTPVLSDGLRMFDGRFTCKLPGGKYIGWVAFERSGFWEGEQAVYSHLAFKANGATVHEHTIPKATPWFELQDVEVLTQEDIADKLIMHRLKTADFQFEAKDGQNEFTLDCDGENDQPARLAALVLAPDTDAGRAYIAEVKKIQRDTILNTQRLLDKSTKQSDPAKAEEALLTVPEPTDYEIAPGDWPAATKSQPLPPVPAFQGMTVHQVVGVFATQAYDLSWQLSDLKSGEATIAGANLSVQVCRFMPQRDYDGSACWLKAQHYWPQSGTKVGPNMARTLLMTMTVPADAKPGKYQGTLTLWPIQGDVKSAPKKIAVELQVHAGSLPAIGMPAGLFFSGVPVPKELIGDKLYWSLTEEMLKQLAIGGRTMVTGGPNWSVTWEGDKPVWHGDDCLKLLKLAHQYGVDQKIINYGGFDTGMRDIRPHGKMSAEETAKALHDAWEEFRKANEIPEEYVYSYDEPGTPDDFAPLKKRLELLKAGGWKTIGFTSVTDPNGADDNHKMLMTTTWAPAFNLHTEATLKWVRDHGGEPWVYNNGLSRYHEGIHLWRNHRAGAGGRVDWIAAIIQGFQYDTLDSREIDPSCFFFHEKFGAMVTPKFMGVCEGGFDARLLWELERRLETQKGTPGAQKIAALFQEIEAQPYRRAIDWTAMEALRAKMITLLEETK